MGGRPMRSMLATAPAVASALPLRVASLTAYDPDADAGKAMQDTAIPPAIAICEDVAVSRLVPRPTELEPPATH